MRLDEAGDTRELAELQPVNHMAGIARSNIDAAQSQNEELAGLNGCSAEFVADASHELRAPLTAMAITPTRLLTA